MKTLIELFETSVEKFPDNPYMWEKIDGKYHSFSYQQIHDEVIAFGAGLMSMGINKGDRIALQAEGRTDWIVAELGMLYAGAINVPLSVKLEAGNDVSFRVNHSGARMIIVSWTQADKVESIFDQCDELEKIIYFDEIKEPADHRLSFQSIKEQGRQYLNNPKNKEAFEAIWKNIQPDDLANISYTSGTTADPKGIMLSHENFTVNTIQGNTLMKIDSTFKTLTILPWDHSFAHTACLYCFMYNGASVACQEIGKTPIETLKNIPKNIKEIEPDLMMSVPAISKSFRKNIEGGIRSKGSTAEKLFKQGLKVAYKYNGNGFNRGKGFRAFLKPIYAFYDKLIFSKIRENFGSNLKFFIGGGALLDTELQRFFAAIGIPVMQGYGLSEASPVISSNALHAYKFGSSGRLVKYLDLKICDEDGNEIPSDQKGEMVIKGGNVMKGYWKNEAATKETIKDGWLYTGDMGYLDKDGFLVVLGRFKSLLISSDGEKYSPEGIEESLVDQSPYIDQAMLYNNQSPYTSAMVVPNIQTINRYLDRNGIKPGSDAGNRSTIELIQNEINEYRKGGKYEGMFTERWLPTTFVILPESFNEQNKLLNSTLKMVRGKITEYFAKELDFLYTPEAKNIYNDTNTDAVVKWNTKTTS
ncbi:MAG: AMP-binding protein [Prolixibacteraceae bacterium]|nr:AMP-binding protein [Prolixibacteraceae bacterium]MBN2648443.1 AMP-binding protein [Prolixibacteraceae bacterium]